MKPVNLTNSKNTGVIKRSVVSIILCAVLSAVAPTANLRSISAQTTSKPAGNSIDKGDFKIGFSPATLKKNPKKVMDKEVAESLLEITKPLNEIVALPYVSSQQGGNELAFRDEHSLDQQRFYDMLCLTYGSNPSKNKNLLGKNGLPPNRAQRCPAEFKRVDHSWQKLLAPYLKS